MPRSEAEAHYVGISQNESASGMHLPADIGENLRGAALPTQAYPCPWISVMAVISGGSGLAAALAAIGRKLATQPTLRVGFLNGATYPDGTSVPMVAAIQEFGAPSRGIPPRPFFRNMVAAHSHEWPAKLGQALQNAGMNPTQAMGQMGALISGELRQSIADTNDPPLAASTIKRKGFAKPLVDTGHMLGSIDFEVT